MFMMRHDITDLHFSGRFDLPEYDRRLLMTHPAVLLTLFKRVQNIVFMSVVTYCSQYVFYIVSERVQVIQRLGALLPFSQRTTFQNGQDIPSECNLK